MVADVEAALKEPVFSANSREDEQHAKASPEPDTKDNIVDWDGPDDPQNPMNWPSWKRLLQVIFASVFLLTA
jgi:hypothetical protein